MGSAMTGPAVFDFRVAGATRAPPKAVVDGAAGMLLASAEVAATPERAFAALMSREIECWWKLPGVERLRDWRAELRPQGDWGVTVELCDGQRFDEWGEICAVEAPHRVVLTRHFAGDPLIGERETTLACRFEPSPRGTLITLREDGYLGRREAAQRAAQNWETLLGRLDGYLSQA